jgi:nucleoside-diphosphate-sugar epimerase
MKIFVTGATGFVGSAVVSELIGAGHQVVGLTRSDASATALTALGASPYRGSLEDLDSLGNGAAAADAVIHTGFDHDFSNFAQNCEKDRRAIRALGHGLDGTNRPLLITSGLTLQAKGNVATEQDAAVPASEAYPRVSEATAVALAATGVNASVVRLPPSVHGIGDHGFVPTLIVLAREKGASAYIGDGMNRWPAVHRLDAARVFRLALECGSSNGPYHAVAEEGVLFKDIATVIAQRLGLPLVSIAADEAASHFGWFSHFAAMDIPTSSAGTRMQLGWQPDQVGLIADIDQASYFTP